MMKKLVSVELILILAFALQACGGQAAPSPAPASSDNRVFTMTVHQHDSATSGPGIFLEAWAEKIEAESGGRLKFNIFHGATLGSARDTIEMIQNGTCDIGWGLQSYFSGQFDGSEVVTSPMSGIKDSTHGTQVIWNLYKNNPEIAAEYENYHVLLLHTSLNMPVSSRGGKFESAAAFNGTKIRGVSSPMMTFATSLGISPVSIAIGELFQAIENNTVDGVITDWHAIRVFSLYEALRYYLDESIGGVNIYFLLMNKDSYNALPDDLKKTIDDNSRDHAASYVGGIWGTFETDVRQLIAENGGEIYKLSDEERANMQQTAENAHEKWIEDVTARGYNGRALFDEFKRYVQQFDR